jgi:hypothetical protein
MSKVSAGGIAVLAVAATLTVVHGPARVSAANPTASAAPAPLSATLVLPTTTVKAGGEISGQVVVENRTGHDIQLGGCGIFQVLLTNNTYQPSSFWATCFTRYTIPMGESSYPITVIAAHNWCSQSGSTGTLPACLPNGPPPLPPGDYQATTLEAGDALPIPAPVKVTVTE